MSNDSIRLPYALSIRPLNAGLFVSTGTGKHPVRMIDSHELIFLRSGTLDLFEETQSFHIEAGDVLILWPGRLHGGLNSYEDDDSFYYVHFMLDGSLPSTDVDCLDIPRLTTVRNPDRVVEFRTAIWTRRRPADCQTPTPRSF